MDIVIANVIMKNAIGMEEIVAEIRRNQDLEEVGTLVINKKEVAIVRVGVLRIGLGIKSVIVRVKSRNVRGTEVIVGSK